MADDDVTNDKVLSQNEVDTLLNAVNDGDVDVESSSGGGEGLRSYDFRKQQKLVRESMPGLKIVFDRFQRSYRQTLSALVRKVVTVEILQTEMLRYSEWVASLPNPSCLSMVRLSPLIGQCILHVEPSFVYTLIDSIFGGGKFSNQFKKEDADFTTIELKMIQKLVWHFTKELEKGWSTFYELKFEFVRTEINPEYISIVAPSDVVIVTDVQIQFEGVEAKIQFVIPLFALDPIKDLLSDHTYVEQSAPNPNWKIWIAKSLEDSKAYLNCELGRSTITMGEVLNLKVGDTIQLDQYVTNPLPFFVEGVPKYGVRMGVSCGQTSVQIESILKRKKEE